MVVIPGSFIDLFNPHKVTIINLLGEFPKKLVDLEKELSIPVKELLRHLDWLEKQKLITKDLTTENYHLGVISQTLLDLLLPINFVLNRADFFREHRLLDLPIWIVRNIDALKESGLIKGKDRITLKIQAILEESTGTACIITDHPFPFGKTEIKTCNLILSPAKILLAQEVRKNCSIINVRFLNSITFALCLSGKSAVLFFPDGNGQTDYNNAFVITDDVGLQFVTGVWNYFWKLSGQLSL